MMKRLCSNSSRNSSKILLSQGSIDRKLRPCRIIRSFSTSTSASSSNHQYNVQHIQHIHTYPKSCNAALDVPKYPIESCIQNNANNNDDTLLTSPTTRKTLMHKNTLPQAFPLYFTRGGRKRRRSVSTLFKQYRTFSTSNVEKDENHSFATATTKTKNNTCMQSGDTARRIGEESISSSTTSLSLPLEAMNKRYLFQYLKLKTYSDDEIDEAFDQIIMTNSKSDTQSYVNEESLTSFILERINEIDQQQHQKANMNTEPIDTTIIIPNKNKLKEMQIYANQEAKRIILLLQQHSEITPFPNNNNNKFTMDKPTFQEEIRNLATKIDTSHTLPIAISMLLVGSSVGIVIPIMPYVVSNLGLSAGQYGMVVSSFALAKLFANVPAAVFVEKHGRKPHLVYSLVIISAGVAGIGFANQFEHLVLCRVLTGIGVSSLSTAATLANADSSTPLNRASTMAPMMSAFAAGTALGPVMGGVLADRVGIQSTFYLVGCSYLALTVVNNMTLNETKLPTLKERQLPWNVNQDNKMPKFDDGDGGDKKDENIIGAMKDATSQWLPLLQVESVRNVVIMNGFYWIALSGSQMTLLPLILTNTDGLAFTATQVGQVYMGMSLVQVLGNPAMATVIDKIGKVPGILMGCTFLSTAMFTLPYCTEMSQVVATCGTWALGSTMLATAPVSYVSDNVSDRKRPQAIALYRTAGDVGFLLGAISTGAVADAFSMDVAVHSNAGMLLTATGWFATRSFLLANRKN